MANSIKIKRSSVAAKVPLTTDLALGELAINTYDGKLYLKKDNGTASIVTVNTGDGAVVSITGTANEIDVSSPTGAITLSLPATINSDTTGSAATLTTPRDIAGVSFDGSASINIPLSNLSDVTFSTPVVNELLGYNGTAWVNVAPNSASAGTGVVFYNATPVITAAGTDNDIAILTFASIPVTTAEQVITGTAVSNTVLFSAFITVALNRLLFDAGVYDFTIWAGVNSIASHSVTTITRQIYTATPFVVGTVTTTGTGSSRTATASSGTPFATAVIDASATNTVASFLQTPQGLYQITARTSDTVVTITTPSGYTNESAVAGTVWKKLFGVTTPEITSISPDYSEISIYTTQPSTVVTAATKMGILGFVTSDHTRTISLTYNGTTRNTHVNTPLANLHNDLAGLNGGAAGEYYHSTAAEYTGTGTGVFVRATSPTLVTPALGTPTALVGTNISGTATAFTASNVTTNANLTGEVTSTGNATTVTNAAVIAKVLTGYVSGAGTVAATDSILQAVQKLNGNILAVPGTVTSVAALTLGTTGTDLSSTVATGTTTPVITLQVPTASAANRGALSAADWSTFNNKGSGTVTAVSVATANGVSGSSSGGATPALTIALGAITPSAVQVSGLTASQILSTDASKNLTSLAVATYPSLTELAYVKGVTSAIQTQINTKGAGTVTSASVVSANGFAGTVATATSTPAITLTTSITGVLKGNATAISAATSGTDYSLGTSALATGIVKSTTTTGALTIAIAADFPTLNQSTTGSAATLTTPRAIYGNNFDGSAALTQIIASTYGGTGNGFSKFSGATTAERTYTLPDASTTILTTNSVVTAAQGGTSTGTYTTGDILYASAANTLSKLPAGTVNYVLTSGGAGVAPSWAVNPLGTVTSVGFTGGIISVATGTTTPAFTVAGTSGGIPYFSTGTTWATSTLLAASSIMLGGGAGAAPTTTTTGTGVVAALGVAVGSAGAFITFNGAAGTPSSITLTNAGGTAASLTAGTATSANGVAAGVVAGEMVYDKFVATASQTTFTTTVSYISGKIEVYANGVKMVNVSDVTVTSGTSVVFLVGLTVGTNVDLVYPT